MEELSLLPSQSLSSSQSLVLFLLFKQIIIESKYLKTLIFRYINTLNKSDGRGVSIRYSRIRSLGWLIECSTDTPQARTSVLLREKIVKSIDQIGFPSNGAMQQLPKIDLSLFQTLYQHFKKDGIARHHVILDSAATIGRLDVVTYLIGEKHPFTNRAVDGACRNGHLEIVKSLLSCDYIKEEWYPSAGVYRSAIIGGYLPILEYLDNFCPIPLPQPSSAITCSYINLASEYNHEQIVRYLLNHKNEGHRSFSYMSLRFATRHCNDSMYKILNDNYKSRSIHFEGTRDALVIGNLQAIKNLIDMGAILTPIDGWSMSSICQSGNTELLEYLLDEGKLKPLHNSYFHECVVAAVKSQNLDMVKMVCDFFPKSEGGDWRSFDFVCFSGNLPIIEFVYKEFLSRNGETPFYRPHLHFKDLGTLTLLDQLLPSNFEISSRSVVDAFADKNDRSIAEYLLKIKKNNTRECPIAAAIPIITDDIELAQQVLSTVATQENFKNHYLHYSAFIEMARNIKLSILRLYLDMIDADVDLSNSHRELMFMAAIHSKRIDHLDTARYIYTHLPFTFSPPVISHHQHIIERLVSNGDMGAVEYLFEIEKYDTHSLFTNEIVFYALERNQFDIAKFILQKKKGMSISPKMMQAAIGQGNIEAVQYLISKIPKKIDPNQFFSPTCFDRAIVNGQFEIINFLKDQFKRVVLDSASANSSCCKNKNFWESFLLQGSIPMLELLPPHVLSKSKLVWEGISIPENNITFLHYLDKLI